jgi:hypothetical protein
LGWFPQILYSIFALKPSLSLGKQRGQVFILDTFHFFSIFLIFLSIFLSFLNFSLTRLHAWDTPDSPIPKYVPITFSLSPVYLWQGNILTFRLKAPCLPKMDSTSSNISFRDALLTNSFKPGKSLSGFLPDKNLSLTKAIKAGLPSSVELTTSSNGLLYFLSTAAVTKLRYLFCAIETLSPKYLRIKSLIHVVCQ